MRVNEKRLLKRLFGYKHGRLSVPGHERFLAVGAHEIGAAEKLEEIGLCTVEHRPDGMAEVRRWDYDGEEE